MHIFVQEANVRKRYWVEMSISAEYSQPKTFWVTHMNELPARLNFSSTLSILQKVLLTLLVPRQRSKGIAVSYSNLCLRKTKEKQNPPQQNQ